MTNCFQDQPFVLNVNLGAISRLETISVQSHGENTQGMEIVCKVKDHLRQKQMRAFIVSQ